MADFVLHPSPSGSLMHEIHRLVAPPGRAATDSDGSSDGRGGEWKAPRPVNHLECDSCGTDGDLLCCDRCPASFHPECLNPPMEKESAPTHDWFCHECSLRIKGEAVASACVNSNEDSVKRVFAALTAFGQSVNPKEFELPPNCQLSHRPIPGGQRQYGKARLIELELGALVPLPPSRCFNCGDTCRQAPLLRCDFCNLCYHLDCLHPPLTVAPSRCELWMCPAHAEQLADLCLLDSARISDRLSAWDEVKKLPSVRGVQKKFLARCNLSRHLRRANANSVRGPVRTRVPYLIKATYQSPPPLLPITESYLPQFDVSVRELWAAAALEQLSSVSHTKAKCHAMLQLIDGPGHFAHVTSQSASIGLLPTNSICINTLWGKYCPFITGEEHAVIFKDPHDGHYELLNYSEHGTLVDGTLYSPDFPATAANCQLPCKLASAVNELLSDKNFQTNHSRNAAFSDAAGDDLCNGKSLIATSSLNGHTKTGSTASNGGAEIYSNSRINYMNSSDVISEMQLQHCSCRKSLSSLLKGGSGWEGSALLRNGSIIQIGCISLLFIIV